MPTQLKPNTTKLYILHAFHLLSPFLGLDSSFEASILVFQLRVISGLGTSSTVQPDLFNVPFPPVTSASHATTFEGFLTTLTLPREEVITVREPSIRAQPPIRFFSLIRFPQFLPIICSPFSGLFRLCMFKAYHEHLDLFLRSSRNSISLGAVAGAGVPTPFIPDCHGRFLTGAYCP
ncbi:hypothetical protein CRG98_010000 [Punica granatum]|uniref:Uncharacterized protein n=1 Tax=Punica granatum TaxID=22663 RepID=A0A2I0KMA2_PUNGR|nr:hypothetical protein CRG98_010000 [Punica granatum]